MTHVNNSYTQVGEEIDVEETIWDGGSTVWDDDDTFWDADTDGWREIHD